AARVLVHEQIQVSLPVAELDVTEAVPLLGERPERFGEQRHALTANAQFAAAGLDDLAGRADPVAEVEVVEARVALGPEARLLDEELDLAGVVAKDAERELS